MSPHPLRIRAFVAAVDSTGGPDACWPWRGAVNPDGYGQFGKGGGQAHRAAYELMRQPIPDDLVVDHTCHNTDETCDGGVSCLHRRCVNPAHLEAKRRGENVLASRRTMPHRNAAKTHCPQGHEYTPENTRVSLGKNGGPRRDCRQCTHDRYRKRRQSTA